MAHALEKSKTQTAVKIAAGSPDAQRIWNAKVDLAACFRMAARLGMHEGVCNHFSAMVPGMKDIFIVNAFGYAFEEMTASNLLVCDFHGNVVDGTGVPEITAFYIHARVHLHVPHAKVIFHTHMPNATALAMTEGAPLKWAGQTALKFYGRTAVDERFNGLALDDAEGDRIAGAVGAADVIFMKNHGVMVVGRSIAEVWDDTYYLERACEVQRMAESTGRPLQIIEPEIAARTYAQMRSGDRESASAHLASIKRILDKSEADYAA
jgi:ribulose-5-phosphate 4-epimerase/fuculose-1-phosphate aldolase